MVMPEGRLEAALRASEERLRHIVEHAQDLIYYCDIDWRFTYVNPAATRVMKYEESELIGRHFLTLIREDYRATAGELYAKQLLNRTPSTYLEFPAVAKDGETIWIGQHVQLVFEEDRPVAAHAIARDITRQKNAEESLRQAQKMEAVGRLARGVAHDFNNLLAAIIGYSELIVGRLQPGHPASDDAKQIEKAAARGGALTRQLFTFSRNQLLEPELIDLHKAAQSDEPMLRQIVAFGGTITLRVSTPGQPPSVRIDEGQLKQVLLNLLINARDAMPKGGAIELTVDSVEVGTDGPPRYPGVGPGRYARITVRDTGTGIDPKIQPHVFEPFFTTKDPSKGSGLGLSIVYGIAKDAGGTVVFATAPGEGTTFEVLLPLARSG